LWAVKKLRDQGKIAPDATVVLMLTGSGLKDMDILRTQPQSTIESSLATIQADLHRILNRNRQRQPRCFRQGASIIENIS
jgi:threonine synthase